MSTTATSGSAPAPARSPENGTTPRPVTHAQLAAAEKALRSYGAILAVRTLFENQLTDREALAFVIEVEMAKCGRDYAARATLDSARRLLDGPARVRDVPEYVSSGGLAEDVQARLVELEGANETIAAQLEAIVEAQLDARLRVVEGRLDGIAGPPPFNAHETQPLDAAASLERARARVAAEDAAPAPDRRTLAAGA